MLMLLLDLLRRLHARFGQRLLHALGFGEPLFRLHRFPPQRLPLLI